MLIEMQCHSISLNENVHYNVRIQFHIVEFPTSFMIFDVGNPTGIWLSRDQNRQGFLVFFFFSFLNRKKKLKIKIEVREK